MQKKNSQLLKYIEILKIDLNIIKENSLSNFGYKERVKLERTLFLILIELIEIEIDGFNKISYEKIKEAIKKDNYVVDILVDKLFDLQSFFKSISNNNPYVRDDALSKADTNRIEVFNFIEIKINRIELLAKNNGN